MLPAVLTDNSLPNLEETLRMHSQSIDRMIGELPTPLTQTSAPREIRGLCQEFINEIKDKTEPHPEDVREAFDLLETQLSKTHPVFNVSLDSIKKHSVVTPGEPFDPLKLDQRKCLVLFH
jgi:hypothetical protein